MTEEQTRDATRLLARLDAALHEAKVSAVVHVVDDGGEPRLRISSRERGEALERLNRAVASVLRETGTDHHYLGTLEGQN